MSTAFRSISTKRSEELYPKSTPLGARDAEHAPDVDGVQAHTGEDVFQVLAAPWDALALGMQSPPLFATREYVALAWQYSKAPGDHPLVLVLRSEGAVVAIAPLQVSRVRTSGIPARRVEWIASFEGDRPGMLCNGIDPLQAWASFARFLAHEFTAWDTLHLQEWSLPLLHDDPLSRVADLLRETDSEGFYIALQGQDFDGYLAARDAKVRANWRNRSKRLAALTPAPVVDRLQSSDRMGEGVERLMAIEARSWKAEAHQGVGKDARHRDFYLALTQSLAKHAGAEFLFLRSGETDLAGMLLFKSGDVVYECRIAYDEAYAALSPGIVLRVQALEPLFDGSCREFDMMGMHASIGRQRHKADWATDRRSTESLHYIRRHRLVHWLWKTKTWIRNTALSSTLRRATP